MKMKLHRSALVAAFLAFGAVACGDDVTIQDPPPPAPNPLSVTLTPNNQTINVLAVADFAVGVSGGESGATASWTCTSSTPAVASVAVTATGCRATGASAGSVTITATVTKGSDTNSQGAGLTVNAVSTTPATVTISAINQGGVPAPIGAIAGQVDVVLNIERGTAVLQRVDLLVGTTVVASQTLGPAAVSAEGGPDAQAIQQITLSFNSACYTSGAAGAACGTVNETAGTAVVRHQNGPQQVSAQLTVSGGATSLVSSNTVTLNFTNASGFHVVAGLPANSAINTTTGLIWYGGSTTITAVPVIYGGPAVTSVTIGFCGAATDTTLPFQFVRTCAGVEAATALTFTSVAGGNAGPAAIVNAAVPGYAFPLRVDNVGPGAPLFIANPNVRQNGWINGGVSLVGVNGGATSNGWLVNGAADAGVGGYVRRLRIDSSAPGTVAAARSATPSDAPALPDPSLANNDYCAIASAVDLLGNESTLPAAATVCTDPTGLASSFATGVSHLRFGVDITPPTIAFSGGLAANARISAATVGGEFQVTVQDVGTIGNSGMNSASSVVGTVQVARPGLAVLCLVGTGGGCAPASVNAAPAFPLVPTTVVGANATVGYFFYSAVSQDAAGNQSTAVTRVVAHDLPANVPALTTALFNTPITGGSVTFNANGSDNFDLWDIRYTLRYSGAVLEGELAYPAQTLNTFPASTAAPGSVTFVNTNVAVPFTISNFVRQVEVVTAQGPLAVAGGQQIPDQVSGFLRDQVANVPAGSPITTVIPAASVTVGTSYLAAAAPVLADSWAITNAAALLDVSSGNTAVLNADLFGPTATFNSPFSRVDFYVYVDLLNDGATADDVLEQIGTTTAFTTVDDGSPMGRRHRYSITWAPGTTSPVTATGGAAWFAAGGLAKRLFAVGVNAAGDALVTPVNANLTLQP